MQNDPAKKANPQARPTSNANLVKRIEKLEADNKELTWYLANLLREIREAQAKAYTEALRPQLEAAIAARLNGGTDEELMARFRGEIPK